jgi:hypothetical protein
VVRPLPAQGRPAGFAGAVGRLRMDAELAPASTVVDRPATLTVRLTGTGNIRGLPEPRMPEVPGLEIFPTTHDARMEVEGDAVGGTRTFRWTVLPQRPRTYTVPPIEYSYFDPELRTYVTLRSDSLVLQALPAVAAQSGDTAIRTIRLAPGRAPAAWARTSWFAALQAVPLLLVGLAAAVRRRRNLPPPPSAMLRAVRRELEALRTDRGVDDRDRLAAADALLHKAVSIAAGHGAGGEPEADPSAALRNLGQAAAAQELDAILSAVRHGRYAPGAAPDTDALILRAERLVAGLAASARRGRRTPTGVALLLLALSAAALPPHWLRAAELPAARFHAGVEAFETGHYAAAARSFHDYARSHPDDPAGWYNHGVAAFRAGDAGRGVWAWLRAARLAPRDPDVRHNVLVAAGPAALSAVVPWDRLAPGERAAAAALAWWLMASLAIAALLWRRQVAWLAAAPALLLLGLAVAGGRAASGSGVVTPLGQGASAFAGPSVHDEVIAEVPVGRTPRLVQRRDGWLLVRLEDGRMGWVERSRMAAP